MKKNINKIPRIFVSLLVLGLNFAFFATVNADLDSNFRKNFTKFTQEQCFNSIYYSVDDLAGFKKNAEGRWECQGGKCEEYNQLVSCIFNNSFQQAVNNVNTELRKYTGKGFKEIIKNTDKIFNKNTCKDKTLSNTQSIQESLGFVTNCSSEHLAKDYSACRVTETVLNEFCGYQNFLAAKAEDYDSFSKEEKKFHIIQLETLTLFKAQADQYLREIEKAKQAFIDTSFLYKDFLHNYRIYAWISVINSELKEVSSGFIKIMNAVKTFPAKFIDANSLQ